MAEMSNDTDSDHLTFSNHQPCRILPRPTTHTRRISPTTVRLQVILPRITNFQNQNDNCFNDPTNPPDLHSLLTPNLQLFSK